MTAPLPRTWRSRWRWLAVIALIGFVSAGWLLRSVPPQIVFAMSNAETISYRAAGLGRLDHSEQSPAYRWCYRILSEYGPAALSRQLPPPKVTTVWNVTSKTGAEGLILFFERKAGSKVLKPTNRFEELAKLEFESSDRHRFPGKVATRVQYGDGRYLLCFESFPRRDRTLVIHLTDLADETKTFRFEIDNPGYRPDFPRWTPEDLPQTKSDSGIDVTLLPLSVDSLVEGKALPVNVTTSDPAWKQHGVISWLEDATGNIGNALSPFEPAWKGRVSVARTDPATFAPSDQSTFGPFALSAEGSRITIAQSREINGFRFIVQSMEVGQTYTPRSRQPTPRTPVSANPEEAATAERTFRVEISGPTSGFNLIARVDDQTGEQLAQLNHPVETRGAKMKSVHGIRFKPKLETTHVTLTLIASKPKEFEFIFPPPSELRTRSGH